ncbi:enoyl-CoA hydratase/isomerase family protein [Geodermatophilus sp. YIM 151500]|uniref:enoyl-CoA hydratase/isomerase family protein n=1 Tax=Geodermatophilus sp. YIM 151500 TaxID=2984531 RepID=UPI0021E469C0|nr:enoyl-CoA hydratase/isomerase family protein [Geodermatophilus sp. YIM 151500]MCV2489291.1 enoyl-CoA hydratase/isomerase family protein [Geodermatophilus sp. YIM 151500]
MAVERRTRISVEVADRVATLTMDGAHVLNALHSETHREMQRAFDELDLRDDVGAVLVRGAGRAFCSGSDLREIGNIDGPTARRYVQLDWITKNRIAGSPKPVVAAIQGYCVGGGVELAVACDIRIAASDAVFSMREVPLGSVPGSGGLQRLPSIVGRGVAKDWVLTGRDVPAEEALLRGLVSRLVAPVELEHEARVLASSLAGRNATAMHLAKVALDPQPEPDRGLVATFQMLAGAACHTDPRYHETTSRFTGKQVAGESGTAGVPHAR